YGSVPLLVTLGLTPILGYAGLALAQGWGIVLVGLCFPLSRGITQIILKDAINWRTQGAILATVLSLLSLLFRVGFAIIGPLTGWSIDHLGMRSSLWLLAAGFALAFAGLMLPLLREVRLLQIGRPQTQN